MGLFFRTPRRGSRSHISYYGVLKLDQCGRIGRFLPCKECGYELRGCNPMAKCPECGHSIRLSIRRLLELRKKQTLARPGYWGIVHGVSFLGNVLALFAMLAWTSRAATFCCVLTEVFLARLLLTIILAMISLFIHIHLFRWRIEHAND